MVQVSRKRPAAAKVATTPRVPTTPGVPTTLRVPTTPGVPTTPRVAARCRDELGALLDPGFFAALADPSRARIVACIARCRRACAVGEIAGCCALDLSVVSRHLKALAAAGILAAEKDGRMVRYRLCTADIAARLRGLAAELEASAPCDAGADCCGGPDGCC